jgi:5-methyltetrahydropteroyltriglutamate--homocysteine methyltransferase
MFTATANILLPTAVTGSWPRPAWFADNLAGRSLSEAMAATLFREQFLDATAVVVNDQQRAGLDILTNGDYHLDADYGGQSWSLYPIERLNGVSQHRVNQTSPEWTGTMGGTWQDAVPAGGLLRDMFGAWRFPRVEHKIEPGVPLEFAKIWRTAQARAMRPVKFGTIAPDAAGAALSAGSAYDDNRRAMLWDIATVLNAELRDLVAAGCRVVQIEEPNIHVLGKKPDPALVDFHVDLYHHTVEGLDDAEIWVHTCWGNPGGQIAAHGDYGGGIAAYLERVKADVWTIESKHNNHRDLPLFAPYRGKLTKKIALGVINHRTVQVESPDEVAADIRQALEYIDVEHLVLSSDCGFGRGGVSRDIALYKAAALAQGANIVRRELGLPETPVPLAELGLLPDG